MAIGLLLGSYAFAALVNAVTLTQPPLKGTPGRARVVVVAPPAAAPHAAPANKDAAGAEARPVIADRGAQKSI